MTTNIRYDDPSFDTTEAVLEKEYGLPRGLMSAIRTRGERSNNNQVSPKGARGVYQFIPATWAKFADPDTDPTDPDAAATAAARYLSYAMKQYDGNVGAVISEYNGGPKAAKAYLRTGDPGNKETRDYLKRVQAAVGESPQYPTEVVEVKAPVKSEPLPVSDLPVAQAEVPSPFGSDEYTTSPTLVQPMSALPFSQAPVDMNNVSLDTYIDVPDMELIADNLLETQIGAIVDEVLNG